MAKNAEITNALDCFIRINCFSKCTIIVSIYERKKSLVLALLLIGICTMTYAYYLCVILILLHSYFLLNKQYLLYSFVQIWQQKDLK